MIAILWLVIIVLGTTGQFVLGLVLSIPLILLHMMLGCAKKGIVSKKFLFYPLGIWAVLWITSFILSGVFADMFAGVMPSFTILGLHPSFAPTVFLYWIGGQLTLSLGYYLYQDEWLSEKEWNEFCAEAKEIKEGAK